jgi:hypothetical protein
MGEVLQKRLQMAAYRRETCPAAVSRTSLRSVEAHQRLVFSELSSELLAQWAIFEAKVEISNQPRDPVQFPCVACNPPRPVLESPPSRKSPPRIHLVPEMCFRFEEGYKIIRITANQEGNLQLTFRAPVCVLARYELPILLQYSSALDTYYT